MTATNSSLRFEFGKNWSQFLRQLDEERICEAEKSLKVRLGSLEGKIFLDVGSGSGLFSLAAYRLGAQVLSFDFDPDSVQCTHYLKMQFAKDDMRWDVKQGSILDKAFLKSLGKFDVIYSWGVLHHTGNMYQACENIAALVANDGRIFISIYNDQGGATRRWRWVKEKYNKSGFLLKFLLCWYTLMRQWTITFARDLLVSGNPFKTWISYGKDNRGMSAWYDVIDWVGGYPFEAAKPEDIFNFFKDKSFELVSLKTCAGGLGCNEFIFQKINLK